MSTSGFAKALLQWKDFYFVAASVAAVLLGLLFLGVSINVERSGVQNESQLVESAAQTALDFIYVVLISLLMVMPPQLPWVPTGAVVLVSAVGLLDCVVNLIKAISGKRHLANPAFLTIAFCGLLIAALGLIARAELALYSLALLSAILIGAGTRNSWLILLRSQEMASQADSRYETS